MSYVKQSVAQELIRKALDLSKINKDFRMVKKGGRCYILLGTNKNAMASGPDWANAISDLVNQLTIIKARKQKKKVLITKDGKAHILKQ